MGFFFLKIWLKLTYYLRPTYLAKKCPHRTKKMGLIKVHGRERIMSLKENDSGGFDYCIACIAKKTIRCAWCGNPIFIGDPVTLYSPKKGVKMPDHAVRYKDTDCYVGCLGWDCAETGGDRAGFWAWPGKVYRVPTVEEMIFASFGVKGVICIDDLSNPNDQGRLHDV